MDKFLPLALILLIFSCNSSKDENNDVFFAGEIVNPTNDYVVLFKGSSVIDSAKLDGNNRFTFHLNDVEGGLYHFNHEPEQQYVYLEQGDSLMLRLNTMYFDETLVYSGTNEELNNFLLEVFLADEEVEKTMYSDYYELEAADFSEKIDQLRKEKLHTLDLLKVDAELSKTAYEIGQASINYTFYRYKEIYPFKHKRKLKEDELHNIPESFYSYRNAINYNNKNLIYLRPYYNFMKSHLGNMSYMTCSNSCGKKNGVIINQLHFNKHKLNMIDSLLTEKELRDNLFRNVAIDYLLREHDAPDSSKIFIDEFQKVSGNNMHFKEIEKLYQGIQNIQPNSPVPDIDLITMDSLEVSLKDIAKNKNAVFYFWSATDKNHYENLFDRVRKLEKMKPDYDFIGINFRTDNNNWKSIVNISKLNHDTQYRADDFEQLSEKLILYPLNKCVITKDALIVDAFSNIYRNL